MKRLAVLSAVAVVLVADAVILGLAAWNRTGTPRYRLSVTERELAIPVFRDEDTTELTLRLVSTNQLPMAVQRVAWRRRAVVPPVDLAWFDSEKLQKLGFRIDVGPSDPGAREHYATAMERPALIVLELDGEGFRRWLATRQAQLDEARRDAKDGRRDAGRVAELETLLELDRAMRSRLFPIDAGRDADALRSHYPDNGRTCIVPGLVRIALIEPDSGPPQLRGQVVSLLVATVEVPSSLRPSFSGFLSTETLDQMQARERQEREPAWPVATAPRYQVELAVGRSYEPWITAVEASSQGQ